MLSEGSDNKLSKSVDRYPSFHPTRANGLVNRFATSAPPQQETDTLASSWLKAIGAAFVHLVADQPAGILSRCAHQGRSLTTEDGWP